MMKLNKDISNSRQSNIELYRILVMLLIVAHHYVVNSGITQEVISNPRSLKAIWIIAIGAWGKTGINCFVLITGYFMCKSQITIKKWLKLFAETELYRITIWLFFAGGAGEVSVKGLLKIINPITSIGSDFVGCFLIFYLFIPFLNILINNMNEKTHILLVSGCLFVYTFLGSIPNFAVYMNYVSWFVVLYFIAAYIRLYPKKIYKNTILWICLLGGTVFLSLLSMLIGGRIGDSYFFLSDSNKICAVLVALVSFILFVNLPIKSNKFINTIAECCFGVLLIHTASDAMRTWLWKDLLHVAEMYYSDFLYIHTILSVVGIFVVCSMIDILRKNIFSLVYMIGKRLFLKERN